MRRRAFLLGTGSLSLASGLATTPARADAKTVRIGVLNDMSGIYADYQGPGSLLAARMAVEEWGGKAGALPVEVVFADHQNKPDVGMAIARRWLDQDGVDVVVDVPNSAIALAVADLIRERNRVFIGSGAGIVDLTGSHCSPNTVHWTYDTWEVTHSLARAIVARGGKTWFTLAADYTFGADLDRNILEAVAQAGGRVLGGVKHPFPTDDFSSFLLAAQASGAQVLALDNGGGDTSTSLKQAAEFGLTQKMQVCGPVYNINMAHSVGLDVAKGVLGVSPFYWDLTDATREWSTRFAARHPHHAMPNDMQAGVYSGVVHYLKAVQKLGSADDGRAVVAAMKAIPTDDKLFGKGTVRADGRKMHPVFLLQTKTPAESKSEWDIFSIAGTVPADQAFRPLAEGHCALASG